ncbi:MAG: homocysteine S-methyltransferase [Gemmatimonadetes bacterium]|nr:homocysteine S-methyltransferase [Gemmatimonadota bacterium]
MKPNPLARHLESQGVVILDGGLATALEAAGHMLDSALWSARLLLDAPEAVRAAHLAYLEAGADVITTASYQASFEGFAAAGLGALAAESLLRRSVDLAVEARRAFWSDERNRANRLEPIVAASIGPYGAFLADGSEYRGRYLVGRQALAEFHRRRLHVLADTQADVLAIEKVPSVEEAEVLAELLAEVPHAWAWMTFSCRDGKRLWDKTRIADAVRRVEGVANMVGVGVNCTAPRHVASLVAEVRSATSKTIVLYPNSGETYDAASHRWVGRPAGSEWVEGARAWAEQGARVIGGCCRVGPRAIRDLRDELMPRAQWR